MLKNTPHALFPFPAFLMCSEPANHSGKRQDPSVPFWQSGKQAAKYAGHTLHSVLKKKAKTVIAMKTSFKPCPAPVVLFMVFQEATIACCHIFQRGRTAQVEDFGEACLAARWLRLTSPRIRTFE
jgi:hypothetical protein